MYTTRPFRGMTCLCRAAAEEYGWKLPFLSLRHAVLAWSAFTQRGTQFQDQLEFHTSQAKHWLKRNLQNPATISEADALAAFMLGAMASDRGPVLPAQLQHLKGAVAILRYLSNQGKSSSELMQILAPLIHRYTNTYWTVAYLLDCTESVQKFSTYSVTSFHQRSKYMEIIALSAIQPEVWDLDVEAIYDVLNDFVFQLVCCIIRVAIGETSMESTRPAIVKSVLDAAEGALSEPDFLKSLETLGGSLYPTPISSGSPKCYGKAWYFQQYRGVHLAIEILSSTSILQGLARPKAQQLARQLLSDYKSRFSNDKDYKAYAGRRYHLYLMLAGLALPSADIKTRIYSEIMSWLTYQ